MDIAKYLTILPEEVLLQGRFCVTKLNDKKPYDPFLKKVIGAKDPFYSIDEILDADNIEDYDTFGIKVMGDISSIDIDHCVVDGQPDEIALDIIHAVKSYTEISPSGTGIRILFKAQNAFDRERYKIKNSSRGIEYYDGVDQLKKGARMVRLSGDKIFDYCFNEVDTTDILDRYMARDFVQKFDFDDEEINEHKCYFIGEYLKKDYSIYEVYYRHMSALSESEWDLMLANHISFYSQNINEIRYIFENSTYYKRKDARHINKWKNTNYSHNMLKVARPQLCNEKVLKIVQMYDECSPQEDFEINPSLAIYVAIQIGFIKPSYMNKYDYTPLIPTDAQSIVNHATLVASKRRSILKYLQGLCEVKE